MSNSTRCAACKSLRRKCAQDCVLAPYFPSNNPQRFACVHKIFGASNVCRMLKQLPIPVRAAAADCLSDEATHRVQDPVYGCVKIIDQLQQQITMLQHELAKTQGEIAFYRAKQAQQSRMTQQAQEEQMSRDSVQQGEPSWLYSSHLEPLYFDLQSILDFNQQNDQ
ncbi:hypothetical protein IFM89_009158, partial [Coptis chinensis]